MSRKRIAIFLSGLENTTQKQFARGLETRASTLDIDLCFFHSLGGTDSNIKRYEQSELEIFRLPDLSRFDGVVEMMSTVYYSSARRIIRETLATAPNLPRVSFDYQEEGAICLTCDDGPAIRELVRHLYREHNARRIVFVAGPRDNEVGNERRDVYYDTMHELGLCAGSEDVYYGDFKYEGGKAAVAYFLEREPRPDAFVCANDDMALGLMDALAERGFRVPGDFKVTAFDATEAAIMHEPSLTTARRPLEKAGETAVSVLHAIWNGEQPQTDIRLRSEVKYGQSCGCVRKGSGGTNFISTLYRRNQSLEYEMIKTSSLSNALADAQNDGEFRSRLLGFLSEGGLDELYLCVDRDRLRMGPSAEPGAEQPGQFRNLRMIFGYYQGRCYEEREVPSVDQLPAYQENRPQTSHLVFSPMYHRNTNFGYMAFDLEQASGFLLYAVIVVLGGALESLSLRTTIHEYAQAIEQASLRDPLTGLMNRRGAAQVSDRMLEAAREEGRGFLVVCADLDCLKIVNDKYGHHEGDAAIQLAADALRSVQEDGLLCIHMSGDEFMLLGLGYEPAALESVCARTQAAMERINRESGKPYAVSLSMGGLAKVPQEGDSFESLYKQADAIMYREKNRRKKELNLPERH